MEMQRRIDVHLFESKLSVNKKATPIWSGFRLKFACSVLDRLCKNDHLIVEVFNHAAFDIKNLFTFLVAYFNLSVQ